MGLIKDVLKFFGFVHKSSLMFMNIDLGSGVKLRAPIKLNMSFDEWNRMSNYINGRLGVLVNLRNSKSNFNKSNVNFNSFDNGGVNSLKSVSLTSSSFNSI